MNEHIEELAEQAGINFGEMASIILKEEIETFAKLLIGECVKQSLRVSHRNDDMGAIIANMIRKHFGVK